MTAERVVSWGMAHEARCVVRRPRSREEIAAALDEARRSGRCVGLRGGGNSYGDASMLDGQMLLDLSDMNRVLEWNAETGVLRAEPGARIADLWRTGVVDGWWPPVVSGTMFATVGGAAAMNIHGKNNFKLGTFGEHVLDFDFMLPDGTVREAVSPQSDPELFRAAISGIGALGVFLAMRVQLKRMHSGLLEVEPFSVKTFGESVDLFRELEESSDYLVGWHDTIAGGERLGRGIIHRARYLEPGEDPKPQETSRLENQELPLTILGLPKSLMWMGLWFFMNRPGMGLVNAAKYVGGVRHAKKGAYRQAHAAFHFLLDYVPDWKYALKPGGMIQFQSFIPKEHAARVMQQLCEASHAHGLRPYLCVTKRHRTDPFLLSHAVDGFSQALEFRVTKRNRARVWSMAAGLEELVLDAGGRFYFAKDSVMRPETLARAYPAENVAKFAELKKALDPDLLFQTDLLRRVFPEHFDLG